MYQVEEHKLLLCLDKGILLATKTLVESICHYSRDPSGVFFVCHAREWHIDKKWHIDVVVKMAVEFQVCGVERRGTFITFASNKKMLICL